MEFLGGGEDWGVGHGEGPGMRGSVVVVVGGALVVDGYWGVGWGWGRCEGIGGCKGRRRPCDLLFYLHYECHYFLIFMEFVFLRKYFSIFLTKKNARILKEHGLCFHINLIFI